MMEPAFAKRKGILSRDICFLFKCIKTSSKT